MGEGEKGKAGGDAEVVSHEQSRSDVSDRPIFDEVVVELVVGHNGGGDGVLRVFIVQQEIGVCPISFFVDGDYTFEGVSYIACIGVEQPEVGWFA